MKVYENRENQWLVEEEERVEEKENTAKEAAAEESEATRRRGPRRRELTNYRSTFKETTASELERL